jgi:hypothetical protein
MLTPKVKSCFSNNCSELSIKEATGIYSPSDNVGGWGNPNNVFADFTGSSDTASITIEPPTGGSFTFNVKSVLASTTLPNAYFSGFTFDLLNISPLDLGISTGKFPDGVYTITYHLEKFQADKYITTFKILNTCNIDCCLQKMFLQVYKKMECGDCNVCETFANYYKAKAIYQNAVRYAYSLHNYHAASELLKQAQKYCHFNNCKC